jgi:leader peptidase (prepilin peptidase)/N-methyltransferase
MRWHVSDDLITVVFAFVFGSIFGSFLNVCIVRLPEEESIISPPSKCPGCGHGIQVRDNIPILGWIILRGRCRNCKEPISVMYPLVELLVGLVWAGSVWHYGLGWTAAQAAVFGTLLLGIGLTDARTYIIPDEFSLGGLGLGLALSIPGGWESIQVALIGAAVGFGLLYAVAWLGEIAFKKEAMGGGDIKMMAMVGAFVGWPGVIITIFGGALLGTIIFVPISWKTGKLVPFGVFLACAGALVFVFQDQIIAWYLGYLMDA